MKAIVFILTLFFTGSRINTAYARIASSNQNKKTAMRSMGREGDMIWVIVNHLKADKRQDFKVCA